MAKFNFRLQGYLGIKEKIEDQQKLAYGQALSKLEEERQKKAGLLAQRDDMIAQFRESLHTLIKPAEISRYNNTIERIKYRIIEQDKRIKAAEANAETKRLALVEAMKERKTLESLRDKQFETYTRDEQLAEQKIVDEMVSYQYADRMEAR